MFPSEEKRVATNFSCLIKIPNDHRLYLVGFETSNDIVCSFEIYETYLISIEIALRMFNFYFIATLERNTSVQFNCQACNPLKFFRKTIQIN